MEINNNFAPIYRLKRKWNDDPLEMLSISIKRTRKTDNATVASYNSSAGYGDVIKQSLLLAKSSEEPNVPEFAGLPYHDLNALMHNHFDELIKDCDALSADQPSCSGLGSNRGRLCYGDDEKSEHPTDPIISCNGRPMLRMKTAKSVKNPCAVRTMDITDCAPHDDDGYVYDFYVPKNYDTFKHGLPDNVLCNILPEHMLEGVISLNACQREVFNGQQQEQVMPDLIQNCPDDSNVANRLLLDNLDLDSNQSRDSADSEPIGDDDEDSNDENDWRNDYPDEDDPNFVDKNPDFYDLQDYGARDSDNDGNDNADSQSFQQNLTTKFKNFDMCDDDNDNDC